MTDPAPKLSYNEVMDMFGGSIPMEAMSLLFDAPGTATLGDVQRQLTDMAVRWRASRDEGYRAGAEIMKALHDFARLMKADPGDDVIEVFATHWPDLARDHAFAAKDPA